MSTISKKVLFLLLSISLFLLATNAVAEEPLSSAPSFLLQKEDFAANSAFLRSKRSSFDSEKYRYETYYWRTNMGDTILLKLGYAGEIIDAFQDFSSWESVADSKIVFTFSWFFSEMKQQMLSVNLPDDQEIAQQLAETEKHHESYALGPFNLDWAFSTKGYQPEVSSDFFVDLRTEVNMLLMQDKLRKTAHDLVTKKLVKKERIDDLIEEVDKAFAAEQMSYAQIKENLHKKDGDAPSGWGLFFIILAIIALVAGLVFAGISFSKRK